MDYSTGSVGIGATAPIWGAMARRYLSRYLESRNGPTGMAPRGPAASTPCSVTPNSTRAPSGRRSSTPASPTSEIVWVVDINRQSLDQVVPLMTVNRLRGVLTAAGWQRHYAEDGRCSPGCSPGRRALRHRIDAIPNPEPQRLPAAPDELRRTAAGPVTRGSPGSSPTLTMPPWRRPSATSAGMTSVPWTRPTGPSTTARPRSSSPTRSRATAWPSRGTRRTTPRCSPRLSSAARGAAGHRPGRPWQRAPGRAGRGTVRADRRAAAPAAAAPACPAPGPARPRPHAGRGGHHPGGAGPGPARPDQGGARGGPGGWLTVSPNITRTGAAARLNGHACRRPGADHSSPGTTRSHPTLAGESRTRAARRARHRRRPDLVGLLSGSARPGARWASHLFPISVLQPVVDRR